MNFCPNCGKEINKGAFVCLACGHRVNKQKVRSVSQSNGKGLATISVVFGSLGFYPLIFFDPIVGIVTGIIGIYDKDNMYIGRSKVGLWLSVGSFSFWLVLIVLITLFNN